MSFVSKRICDACKRRIDEGSLSVSVNVTVTGTPPGRPDATTARDESDLFLDYHLIPCWRDVRRILLPVAPPESTLAG